MKPFKLIKLFKDFKIKKLQLINISDFDLNLNVFKNFVFF